MSSLRPFHLAVPVNNLDETGSFYRDILGFKEGRSSERWIDFDFYGHQFVIHLAESKKDSIYNPVDGYHVPVPHFGVVLDWHDWLKLEAKLKRANVDFIIAPYVRFKGEIGEQATMFFMDPSGNALEFKAFKNESQLFAK